MWLEGRPFDLHLSPSDKPYTSLSHFPSHQRANLACRIEEKLTLGKALVFPGHIFAFSPFIVEFQRQIILDVRSLSGPRKTQD